ncbi:unnamed protein product, partial [marine sediment metagenome]
NIILRTSGAFRDFTGVSVTTTAQQATSVTATITSPAIREATAGSSGNSVTYRITPSGGTADKFKISNPFTGNNLSVDSVEIDGRLQWFQESATPPSGHPTGENQIIWYYDTSNDRLEVWSRQSAVVPGKNIDITFKFDAPTSTSTGNNFNLYAFDDFQDAAAEDTTNIINTNVDFDIIPGPLDHFVYTTNPGATETAGGAIAVFIEARDSNDNLVDTYVGPAVISDTTGTISEGSAGGGVTSIVFIGGEYDGTGGTLY